MIEYIQSQKLVSIGIQVVVIIAVALIIMRLIRVAAQRISHRIDRQEEDPLKQARLKTILSTGVYVLVFITATTAVLMILIALGVNVTPIIASLGVVSLALSLGAQSLIKDYIGGLMILFEDQFRVGDVVDIEGNVGTVEQITLRYTQLRDLEGRLVFISNGDVRIVTRVAYDWARVIVDVNVAFGADIGRVVQVLEAAMLKAKDAAEVSADLLEVPVIQGWNSTSAWGVQVRISAKTKPNARIGVAAFLRRCALESLRDANIKVVSPIQDDLPGAA
jgi:small conductance mechanosensitive channel